MQEQLSCVETRLRTTAASNRRNGPLGTLKRVLKDEFNALVKQANVRQPGKLLVQPVCTQQAAGKAARALVKQTAS